VWKRNEDKGRKKEIERQIHKQRGTGRISWRRDRTNKNKQKTSMLHPEV
jgi:hypothetical protein